MFNQQIYLPFLIGIYFLVTVTNSKTISANDRVKRGFSKYGENDYGPSIHVSSSVLQLGKPEEETINLEEPDHYVELSSSPSASWDEDTGNNGWKPSIFPSGFDVWYPSSANDEHISLSSSSSLPHDDTSSHALHSGSSYISNSVFSTDSHAHLPSANLELHSQSQLHPQSQLHTQIIASSNGGAGHGGSSISSSDSFDHDLIDISDNIDFHNSADLKGKHSYGK